MMFYKIPCNGKGFISDECDDPIKQGLLWGNASLIIVTLFHLTPFLDGGLLLRDRPGPFCKCGRFFGESDLDISWITKSLRDDFSGVSFLDGVDA